MRYAILSDIHANLDALQAVLQSLEDERVDAYACLGDIVGYGPQPVECLREIQNCTSLVIAGNHDYAICGKIDITNFNVYAREAVLWTREALSDDDVDYLADLPLVLHLDGLDLVHGSLYAPELFDYLQTSYDAHLTMERMRAPVCFVGHSHVPVTFIEDEVICYSLAPEVTLKPGTKAIINVGSVGQPRDKDPRASYVIYDTETRTAYFRRVRYNIDAVTRKVREAGLPSPLGDRLRIGR